MIRQEASYPAVGLAGSLLIHALVLFAGGLLLFKPVQFAIERGEASSTEVELASLPPPEEAAAPAPLPMPVPAPIPPPAPAIRPDEMSEPQAAKPVAPPKTKPIETKKKETANAGKSPLSSARSSGARTAARPEYLKNPPPDYPESARQAHHQGVVTLRVVVNAEGTPTEIYLVHSSGYAELDQSALRTVGTWKFAPATEGDIPVRSVVDVPVRFQLNR